MKWGTLKAGSENHGATWIHTCIQMKAAIDQIPRGKELRFIRPRPGQSANKGDEIDMDVGSGRKK